MSNVTFNADDYLLRKARSRASSQHRSLNEVFKEWLNHYAGMGKDKASDYQRLMAKMSSVEAGGRFSRDEMNER